MCFAYNKSCKCTRPTARGSTGGQINTLKPRDYVQREGTAYHHVDYRAGTLMGSIPEEGSFAQCDIGNQSKLVNSDLIGAQSQTSESANPVVINDSLSQSGQSTSDAAVMRVLTHQARPRKMIAVNLPGAIDPQFSGAPTGYEKLGTTEITDEEKLGKKSSFFIKETILI